MAKRKTVGKKTPVKKKTTAKPKAARTVASRAPAKKASTKKATSAKPAAAKASASKAGKAANTKAKAAAPKSTAKSAVRAVPRKKVVRKASKLDATDIMSNPDHVPPTDEQLRKVKTGLTKRDLEKYRQLLLEKRAEILGDVESLQNDARNGAGANISYEHMADTGSDNYEQEFTLGLVASEQKLLAEINDALMRMQEGCYGVCIESGVPIGKARLEAKPWARYCIEVARERERRGQS